MALGQGGLLGSAAPNFRQLPQVDVSGAVNYDYQNAMARQPSGGGGLGSLLSLGSLIAAPFTGGASLGSLFGSSPMLSAAGIGQLTGSLFSPSPTGPYRPPVQSLIGGLFG